MRVNAVATTFFDDDLRALAQIAPATRIPCFPGIWIGLHGPRRLRRPTGFKRDSGRLVGSIAGLDLAREIAAEPKSVALAFGAYDLAAQLGNLPTWEAMASLRIAVVVAARAQQKLVIDAPFVVINDAVGLTQEAERAVEFGFDGKLAIHPRHVGPLLDAFTPSEGELEHARRVLAAVAAGGVAIVDGKMVDPPLVAAARRILTRTPPGGEHD